LIVEDEADLADLVCFHLNRNGFECRAIGDGAVAWSEAKRSPPDLMILDRMLPGISGDEVAKRMRSEAGTADVPILMLTAKAEHDDELLGFALGADDYVRKPFSMKLLLARVAAMLRRRSESRAQGEIVRAGPMVLDHGRHEVSIDDLPVRLTATEFRLLSSLIRANGRVLSRDQLLNATVGQGAAVTDRAIDVHIASLRRKLTREYDLIQTVRGVGYAFRLPEKQPAREAATR
jgi:two-component system phosphate regulon response regulator PhoB